MKPFLSLSGRTSLSVVLQSEAAECGLACLAMIAAFHGYDVDLPTLRRRFGLSMKGMTVRTMVDVGAAIGLSSRPVRCEVSELAELRTPAILHWGTNHFVVLDRVARGHVIVHDPAAGRLRLPVGVVESLFTGIAVELTPGSTFRRTRERNPLRLGSLLSLSGDTARALGQTIVLSLIMEALILAAPFYLQFVIDEGILRRDLGLLTVLALAFGMLQVFRAVAEVFRDLSVQFVSNVVAFDMKGRIFSHLIRLPLEWFQKRHVGDVQSRFWAVRSIQAFVSQGAVTGLLDGILGSVVLVIMAFYSIVLTAILIISLLIYGLVRASSYQISRRYASDAIITDAREQTRLLETLRAAQTLKAAGAETIREGQYRNVAAASINAQIRSGNVSIGYNSAQQILTSLTDVLVVYVGARFVLKGTLTIGMLTAFLAYKSQFTSRFINLVEQAFAWRLLDLQLERLTDVVLTPKEERLEFGGYEGSVLGHIQCRKLSFRYAFGEPYVLAGLDLEIKPGECVAIVGPSGCGKSTLAKLITGLYEPTAGEVAIDGYALRQWNNRELRSQLSFVSQEDELLAGSIAENIAGFAEKIDLEWVRECARLAQIADEIAAMPMGFESLVGDMGSSLSGGQKQRVLIARALYRRPRIVVFDEATAHLDVANEMAVAKALSELSITRILIAHRPETIATADRVIMLGGGALDEKVKKSKPPKSQPELTA